MHILVSGGSVRASLFAALIAGVAIASAADAAVKYPKKRPVLCPALHEPVCTRTSLGILTTYAKEARTALANDLYCDFPAFGV